ncbi:MAG TPA: EamA family transporter, partial [Acidobacteriota bacterium]
MSTASDQAKLIAAFAAVYVIWGSTYLAIRYAIETLPPLLMAGVRFTIAGAILYAWVRLRGGERPRPAHWGAAILIGGLMLFGGNGAVTWATQRIPSGMAALLVATVPLWIVVLDALRGGARISLQVLAGVLLGLVGLAILIGPGQLLGGERADLLGAAVLLVGALSWALGSLCARGAKLPSSRLLATAMQMLGGGALLALGGVLSGELGRVDLASVSLRSLLSVLYLIGFGSLIGFSAYIYLLRSTTSARATTYAYVNPVVAVLLGWSIGGEPLSARILVAAAVILTGVVLILSHPGPAPRSAEVANGAPRRELVSIATAPRRE